VTRTCSVFHKFVKIDTFIQIILRLPVSDHGCSSREHAKVTLGHHVLFSFLLYDRRGAAYSSRGLETNRKPTTRKPTTRNTTTASATLDAILRP
jgi:hypothetical protein